MRARALDETRDRLGRRLPRTFDRDLRRYNALQPPAWVTPRGEPELSSIYALQETLFASGQVVWAAIVQANSLLYEPGSDDCPAMAIYSLDPWYDARPAALHALAGGLFDVKGTRPSDAADRAFADSITDEMRRDMRLPVPKHRCDGRDVYATAVMVHRKHLPDGVLAGRVFPLLHCAGRAATLIVPSRYWSDRLLFAWGEPVGQFPD